eukprot:Skav221691  [mRNA]  locus=scaffold1494:326122:327144:+ [translate_table: standard]
MLSRVIVFLFGLALAEPEVKATPLHCITCAAQQVTCISTAINQCKEQHACDTLMNASSCVSCVGAANCGSDPACSDCSLNQLETVLDFKKLIAASASEEVVALQEPELRTARCSESQSLMKTCGTRCYSNSDLAGCSAKCLRGVGVQSSCASCFGRKIQCSVRNCMRFCSADANSAGCRSCVSRSCSNCNSAKSMEPSEDPSEEFFMSAFVALPQSELEPELRTARCSESQSLMKTCGTRCYSNSDLAGCSAKCLRGVGVQSSCASCFGRKIQCSVRNCLKFCSADANSAGCRSCVSRSCSNCNSAKSMEPSEDPSEESFMSALAALSQSKDEQQPTVFP